MSGTVAFVCMPEAGHFQRLRPLIAGLSARGFRPSVFTHRSFRAAVERAGGVFVDLFSSYPLEHADAESMPVPCRYVSFAAHYAEFMARELRALAPRLLVYDTFAVIAPVVAGQLEIPYVNVCSGHNVDPARFVALLAGDERVRLSPRCERAVELLRERYGMKNASPFSYVSALSPWLNVYCEPPQYLSAAERRVFEPVAFYGSLPSAAEIAERRRGRVPEFSAEPCELRVYVSFGTVVWRYYAEQASRALATILRALAQVDAARGLISLGGERPADDRARLPASTNVRVATYVDQWAALEEADLFVTHHGLNSTHEAIFHGVPMFSYPFFWDQPSLAAKCREFGIASSLTDAPRGTLETERVTEALRQFAGTRDRFRRPLAEARRWEESVLSGRESVLDRLVELTG